MQRIVSRSKYFLPDTKSETVKQLQTGVNNAKQRWETLSTKVQDLVTKQTKVTSKSEKFEIQKDAITAFVTETELTLIGLDPSSSEEEPKIQLEKLKVNYF